jgi:hypothetical protein
MIWVAGVCAKKQTLIEETKMSISSNNPKHFLAAASLALAASVHATTSARFQDFNLAPAYQSPYLEKSFYIDYSMASAAFPSRNFPTWANPNGGATVEYFTQMLNSDVSPSGTCYDISTGSASSGADPIAHVMNGAGTWMKLADDNAGSNMFRARVFVTPRAQREIRISPYFASGTNDQVYLTVKKIRANGGSAINAQSCRQTGVPFHQFDLNGGNPYDPS